MLIECRIAIRSDNQTVIVAEQQRREVQSAEECTPPHTLMARLSTRVLQVLQSRGLAPRYFGLAANMTTRAASPCFLLSSGIATFGGDARAKGDGFVLVACC